MTNLYCNTYNDYFSVKKQPSDIYIIFRKRSSEDQILLIKNLWTYLYCTALLYNTTLKNTYHIA